MVKVIGFKLTKGDRVWVEEGALGTPILRINGHIITDESPASPFAWNEIKKYTKEYEMYHNTIDGYVDLWTVGNPKP